jgi:FkbM family methyltransferase
MSHPFVLWTLQRTGGTALADMLMHMSEHPAAEHEPFNWSRDRPRQFWPIVEAWGADQDQGALAKSLKDLASQGFLIKHCYELFNMAFNVALIEATTKAGYRHILLLRQDEGARLISKFIAEAQGTWFTDYGREVYAEVIGARRKLRPLPADLMVAQYHHAGYSTAALRRAFTARGITALDCTYEDLYRGDRAQRSQSFGAIFDALGFSPHDKAATVAAFLDKTRQGGQKTFLVLSHVPNLEEVVEALLVAGCPPPADYLRRQQLQQLKAQLSRHASARGWTLIDNLDQPWPGFSFKFDHASSLEFRIESADMSFDNIYYGIKNTTPIHNKSLDEALTVTLGRADYSETWPWCRHPNPDDAILPMQANWGSSDLLARGVPDGSVALQLVAAAEMFHTALAATGYLTVAASEWARLQGQVIAESDGASAASKPATAAPQALFQAAYLAGLGLMADIVIDVGVRTGTRPLYAAFPDSLFILVDPQRGGQDLLDAWPNHYRFVNKALGRRPGHAILTESGAKSSLLDRTALTKDTSTETYEVEVTTLDDLIDDLNEEPRFSGRIGIKLDTEGYEIEIIHGLDRHVDKIDFVICEASVRKRFIDGYNFSDLTSLMREKGFLFYNILNKPQRHPLFYDVLFLRQGHRLFE